MSITTEQYLSLSALVNTDFLATSPSDTTHFTIGDIIANNSTEPINDYKDDNGDINPQFLALSALSGKKAWPLKMKNSI